MLVLRSSVSDARVNECRLGDLQIIYLGMSHPADSMRFLFLDILQCFVRSRVRCLDST